MFLPIQFIYFAQTDVPPDSMHAVFVGCILLIIVALVAMIATFFVRRWFKQPDAPMSLGFTLDDLRKLYKEGKMTEAEFKMASAKIAGKLKTQYMSAGANPKRPSKTAGGQTPEQPNLPDPSKPDSGE